jgi:phosphohistidine phosphatase SixA
MKPIQFLFIISILGLFGGCKKEDPILPLLADGFDKKTVILNLSGKFKVKFNQRVTFKTTAGSALQNAQDTLIYSATTTPGISQLTVKSERNPLDSMQIIIATTPQYAVLNLLQKGGYVIIFRHSAADVGTDQLNSLTANWWKSCDSQLARQLNAQGKKDAQNLGKALKTLQIPVARLLASEFCRCYTTADLMTLGMPTVQSKDLTFSVYDEANRYTNTMKLASGQPIDTKNSLFVTHAGFTANIPNPAPLSALEWSDAAVFQLVAGQPAKYITTVRLKEWSDLSQ